MTAPEPRHDVSVVSPSREDVASRGSGRSVRHEREEPAGRRGACVRRHVRANRARMSRIASPCLAFRPGPSRVSIAASAGAPASIDKISAGSPRAVGLAACCHHIAGERAVVATIVLGEIRPRQQAEDPTFGPANGRSVQQPIGELLRRPLERHLFGDSRGVELDELAHGSHRRLFTAEKLARRFSEERPLACASRGRSGTRRCPRHLPLR